LSWEKVKLCDILNVRNGNYNPNDRAISGLKRIDKIDFAGNIYLSDKNSNTNMILIKKGDLVISGINVAKGAMAVYQGDEDVLATIHYSSYEFNKKKIDIEFLKLFLRSPEFIKALNEHVQGGIKTEIKPKHLLSLIVKLPTTLIEQKNIVKKINSRLSQIDNLSFEQSKQIDLIYKLQQQILTDAVQGKLTINWREKNKNTEPATELLKRIKAEKKQYLNEKKIKKEKFLPNILKNEIPFELPQGWVWCRLGEIIEMIYGNSLTKKYYITNAPYPVFGSNGIVGYYYKYLTDKKTIIIGRKGSAGSLNRCNKPSWTTDVAYFIEENDNLNFDFIFYLLKSLRLENLGKGIKPGINRNEAYKLIIPLPPFSEQQAIVSKLEILLEKCNQLQTEIENQNRYNKELLRALFDETFGEG